jgi:hypothetical protein
MRVPRLRIWMLMAVVCLIAGISATVVLSRRSRNYRSRSAHHAAVARVCDGMVREFAKMVVRRGDRYESLPSYEAKEGIKFTAVNICMPCAGPMIDTSLAGEKNPDEWERLYRYHVGLAAKYAYAARHPWWSIAADPPVSE